MIYHPAKSYRSSSYNSSAPVTTGFPCREVVKMHHKEGTGPMAGDQDGALTCSRQTLIIHLQAERLTQNTYRMPP